MSLRSFFVAALIATSGVLPDSVIAVPADALDPISMKTDWGKIESSGNIVRLNIVSLPNDRKVTIPRLNNRMDSIRDTSSDAKIAFTPEPDRWIIRVPKSVALPAVLELTTIETVRLCSEPFVVEPDESGDRITLPAHHANTRGKKLRFEPQPHKDTIGYWTVPEDWAFWKFDVDRPGDYQIEVHQGCGKGQGGSQVDVVVISESDGKRQVISFEVEDTGHFQNFKPRTIGSVSLKQGSYRLEVRPKKLAAKAVCDIRQIRLIK